MNEIDAVSEADWAVTFATTLARNAACDATNDAADMDTWAAVVDVDIDRIDTFYNATEDATNSAIEGTVFAAIEVRS